MNWIIYTLKNPRTSDVRYVGWTSQKPQIRLNNHIQEAITRPRTHRDRWILSLLSIGLVPVLDVLEAGTGSDWAAAERHWIRSYRDRGAGLTNHTEGGEGAPGHPTSPKQREATGRMAAARMQSMTPQQRSALASKANAARWEGMTAKQRDEHIRKMRSAVTVEGRLRSVTGARKGREKWRIQPREVHRAAGIKGKLSMSLEARKAAAQKGGLAAWAGKTPEQREASLIRMWAANKRMVNKPAKRGGR